jgi:hypothetical protein
MSSKVPFVKQEAVWRAIVPRVLFIGILCMVYCQWDRKNYFVLGFISQKKTFQKVD